MPADFIPYCGIPPVPATLKWNLDPVVLTTFAGVGALYYFIAHKKVRPCSQVLFGIGWLISATALISPLCNLSVALFSARVGQHLLLTLIAAPLIVLGFAKKVVLPERNNAACSCLIKIKFVGSTVLF